MRIELDEEEEFKIQSALADAIGKIEIGRIITFWTTVKNVISLFQAYGKVTRRSASHLICPTFTVSFDPDEFERYKANVYRCEIWTQNCLVEDANSIDETNQQIEGLDERLEAIIFIDENAETAICLENRTILTIDELRDMLVNKIN